MSRKSPPRDGSTRGDVPGSVVTAGLVAPLYVYGAGGNEGEEEKEAEGREEGILRGREKIIKQGISGGREKE